MKDLYYNIEDGEFISQSGEKLTRFVPELFYQENAVWRIFLRDRENRPCDISGIIAWSAAVDCDYDSETAPMCRVLPEDISADVAAGSVTVTLDAATAEFLAAVNGVAKCKAFFEMHGVNATGDRKFYFGFEIAARMILDPSPGVPQQVPEIFATRLYADLAAANAASGAIVSGAEIHTRVGEYLLTYTASGGLLVSGGGVALQVSSGGIVAETDEGNGGKITITSGGAVVEGAYNGDWDDRPRVSMGSDSIAGGNGNGVGFYMGGYEFSLEGDAVLANGQPVATQLVTSTDAETTSAVFDVLSGGTSIIYTQPLTAFGAASIGSDCRAEFDFTAASGATLAFASGAGIKLIGASSLDSGTHYLVAVDGARVVVNSYTIVGE